MTDLTRVTVNLIPKADKAMERAAELTGDTKTDTINRALQYYALMCEAQAENPRRDIYLATQAELDEGRLQRLIVV